MGLVVSGKKTFIFSYFSPFYKSMGTNDPWGVANLDPRGMVGRVYVRNYQILLHIKSVSSVPHGFREEDF